MDINILDKNYNVVAVCDSFESLIWNVKYNDVGDFELCIPSESNVINYLKEDYYLEIPDSDRTMIIEHYEPLTDVEDGSTIVFSGRSLESFLTRRIVWGQTIISGNLQDGIKKIITDAFINPDIPARRVDNFVFIESDDPAITSITIEETMFTGDEVLDVINTLCQNAKIGWKLVLRNKQLEFSLYAGSDRTTGQNTLPQVVFSLDNDNLFSARRVIDKKNYKNVTLIGGEGEGTARRTATYGNVSGLDRREYFTDARDISSNEGQADAISASDYEKLLIERGKSKLAERIVEREVEAEVDTSELSMFKYQEDYFIGDIVENVDEYGHHFTSRITEMTIHLDSNGYSSYPTFEQEVV